MRYPLVFGLITALIASGLMVHFASENKKQRTVAANEYSKQLALRSFRFHSSIAKRGANPRQLVSIGKPLQLTSCQSEQVHSTRYDSDVAGLFRQLGWQRVPKHGSNVEHFPISVASAHQEVLLPNRFASFDSAAKLNSPLWNCEVGFGPSENLQAEIRRASVVRMASSAKISAVARKSANDWNAAWSIPSDAVQADTMPSAIDIAYASQSFPTTGFQLQAIHFDSLTDSFADNLEDARTALEMIRNSLPSSGSAGCGYLAGSNLTNQLQPSRLESAILESVCEVNRIAPAVIGHDAFAYSVKPIRSSAAVAELHSIPKIDAMRPFLALKQIAKNEFSRWKARTITAGEFFAQTVASPVSNWQEKTFAQLKAGIEPAVSNLAKSRFWQVSQPATTSELQLSAMSDWNYLAENSLPWVGNSGHVWDLGKVLGQLRSVQNPEIRESADILEPIPAANHLGIRTLATKISRWWNGNSDHLLTRTVNTARTVQQWGMQQNRALERMVLQHNDRIHR